MGSPLLGLFLQDGLLTSISCSSTLRASRCCSPFSLELHPSPCTCLCPCPCPCGRNPCFEPPSLICRCISYPQLYDSLPVTAPNYTYNLFSGYVHIYSNLSSWYKEYLFYHPSSLYSAVSPNTWSMHVHTTHHKQSSLQVYRCSSSHISS